MKLNVKRVEKKGKILILYAKKPRFMDFKSFHKQIYDYFKDYDNFLEIGIDITGKYAILSFILRNREDILLYTEEQRKAVMDKLQELKGSW